MSVTAMTTIGDFDVVQAGRYFLQPFRPPTEVCCGGWAALSRVFDGKPWSLSVGQIFAQLAINVRPNLFASSFLKLFVQCG